MTKQTHSISPETNPTIISIPQLRVVLNGRMVAPDAILARSTTNQGDSDESYIRHCIQTASDHLPVL
jgi:hypothetical protein